MNLVIPYKLDRYNGLELKYAIRSMVKYFTPLDDVILVGDKPTWYTGNHVPCEDIERRKEASIYNKLMMVYPDTVLYSNDDFFALKQFDETLPNFYNYPCREKRPKDRVYRELYRNCPGEWLNYDIHCPMIIDTSRFTEWPIDRPIKTAYVNYNNLPGEQMEDCKIRGNVSYEEMKERIEGRMFFSTDGNVHRPGVLQMINELYPKSSKFEA